MSEDHILKEVIIGYRNMIFERYQYDNLLNKYGLPESINEEMVDRIRNYFLDYVYPEYEKRKELNHAFDSLHDFIKNPQKLLSVLISSARIVFKYGRHLPKILNAGLKALHTFRAAVVFETRFMEAAATKKIRPPFDIAKMDILLQSLSLQEIERFIEGSTSLFETLYDRTLVKKLKEVLGFLITQMKDRPNVFSAKDIKGIEIGLELLTQGDLIFSQLKKEDQEEFIHFVIKVERNALSQIF